MKIKADQFTITYDNDKWQAELKIGKIKFHNYSKMNYLIEIFEQAEDSDNLVMNIYEVLDEFDLDIDWDERMKLMKKIIDVEQEGL